MATNHLLDDGVHHQAPHSTLEPNPYPQHSQPPSQGQAFGPPPGVYNMTDESKWHTPVTASDSSKKILGFRKPTFIFLFAGLLVLLLVVGVVAGGMGAALAQSHRETADAQRSASAALAGTSHSASARSSSTTTGTLTSTPSASATLTILTSSGLSIARDCPASNGTTTTMAVSPPERFLKFCSFLLDTNPTNAFTNTTTSLDACIGLCAIYNTLPSAEEQKCSGVAWRWGSDPPWGGFGTCFGLVGLTGTQGRLADGSTTDTPVDSAYLLS